MNKLLLKKCKSLFLVLLIVPMLMLSYSKPANAIVPVIALEGGIIVSSEALTVLGATTVIAGGAVLNSDIDNATVRAIAQSAVDAGVASQSLAVKVNDAGHQMLTWSASGLDWFKFKVSELQTTGVIPVANATGIYRFSGSEVQAKYTATNMLKLPYKFDISTFSSSGIISFNSKTNVVSKSVGSTLSTAIFYNTAWSCPVLSFFYPSGTVAAQFRLPLENSDTYILDFSTISIFDSYNPSISSKSFLPVGDGVLGSDIDTAIGSFTGSVPENAQSVDDYGFGVPLTITDGIAMPSFDIPFGQSWGDIKDKVTFATTDEDATSDDTTTDTTTRAAVIINPNDDGDDNIDLADGLYGFNKGITADEIKAMNKRFGGTTELNGSIETVLDSASRYDGFWNKTAAITRSIVKNHTFDNGNKRTAQEVIRELMRRNEITTGVSESAMKDIIYKISTGQLNTIEEIATALRGF